MTAVVDASICMAWFIDSERTDDVAAAFLHAVEQGLTAPPLFAYEMANSLLVALRRGRLPAERHSAVLAEIEKLAVALDPHSDAAALDATGEIASRHNLTVYDAAYLELALRRGFPLATLDADLRRAAGAEGVALMP